MAASLHGATLDGLGEGGDSFGGYRPMAEINVTPLVDVMLVLLIIFMVAAPLMMVGVPLDLPKTDAAKVEKKREPIVVSVDKDGRLFVGEDEVREDLLIGKLKGLREADAEAAELPVYVRGDKGIEYGQVMQLLGKIGQAGFAKVSLIAEAGDLTKGVAPPSATSGSASAAPASAGRPEVRDPTGFRRGGGSNRGER